MPFTAADFTASEAEQPSAEAAPVAAPEQQDIVQTPVSQQGASLRRPHPGGLSESFEANRQAINNLPAFLQPLASLGEATARRFLDPAARLTEDAIRQASFQAPKSGSLQGVSDIGDVVSAAVAPEVVAFGGATEALSRSLGADQDSARWIGQAAETMPLPAKALIEGKQVFNRGRAMLTGAAGRIGAGTARTGGMGPAERIGNQIKHLTTNQLRRRGDQLGPVIGRIEREFADTGFTLDPSNPLYSQLDRQLTEASNIGEVAGPAGKQVEELRKLFLNNQPVPASTLVDLKHTLITPARAVRGVAEPALSAAAAAKVRDDITTVLSDSMPNDIARNYRRARAQYGREVGRPRKILATAYSDTTSPMQLFNQVFTGNDPYTLRAVSEVAQNRPALRAKLGLGYLENLAAGANNWQDATKALQTLRSTRGLVEHANILPAGALDDLEYFLSRRSLPQVVESFQALVGTMSGAVKGSAATGMAYVASGKPSHMLMALIASGSLSPMRRLMLVPKGSTAAKRAGTVIASNLARFANEVAVASQQPDEGEEELLRLTAPVTH